MRQPRRLVPYLGDCKQCCYELWGAGIFPNECGFFFFSPRNILRSGKETNSLEKTLMLGGIRGRRRRERQRMRRLDGITDSMD